jgi:FixJ family two-component response regulator
MSDLGPRRPITADEWRLAERCARGRIVVIDDDPEILAALRALFELEQYACETYDSALAYLRELADGPAPFPGPCCLLCDVRLPELDGLELQRRLAGQDEIPMLLMSGSSGAPEAISAFRAGVMDFLIKPLDDESLLVAVANALAVSAERQQRRARRRELAARLAALTDREREVARRVVQGQRNLEIAAALGIGLRTVKRYRGHVMEKLRAETLVDLVRILDESSDSASGLPE